MDRQVVVRGAGQARSLPDRATVRITVDGDGDTRQRAYREAAEAAAAVDEVLTGFADALGRSMTTALIVQPRSRYRKGESVRTGWRALRTSMIEVTAFDQLGDLLSRLTEAGAQLDGPSWELDAGNAAYRQARRSAAEDARRRAEDYASALGLALDAIAWVAEPGLRETGSSFGGTAYMTAASAGPTASGEPIDVSPDELTVQAVVEVGFSIK
jgi:uncharacterized protein YggE